MTTIYYDPLDELELWEQGFTPDEIASLVQLRDWHDAHPSGVSRPPRWKFARYLYEKGLLTDGSHV